MINTYTLDKFFIFFNNPLPEGSLGYFIFNKFDFVCMRFELDEEKDLTKNWWMNLDENK